MNKSELIQAVSDKLENNLSKKDVTAVIDSFLDTVTETLANGDSIALVGFGTFSVKHRAARKGVNPQTGATIEIKAANVPGFKAGKSLKDACNLIAEEVE